MVCGLPVALSLIETEALRVPMAVGWNVMLIVQFAVRRQRGKLTEASRAFQHNESFHSIVRRAIAVIALLLRLAKV
jgi:hypothetical protein